MTKVTISGNASGTGNVNFAAPNTNSAITVTLPTSNVDMDALGPSTDFNTVGTYSTIFHNTGPDYAPGSSVAINGNTGFRFYSINLAHSGYSVYPSGTWRNMTPWNSGQTGLCVRIA